MNDIDKILMSSSKAELIEQLTQALVGADKVIIVLIKDKEEGKYTSQIMSLGTESSYEACGILEVAKQDLMREDT